MKRERACVQLVCEQDDQESSDGTREKNLDRYWICKYALAAQVYAQ